MELLIGKCLYTADRPSVRPVAPRASDYSRSYDYETGYLALGPCTAPRVALPSPPLPYLLTSAHPYPFSFLVSFLSSLEINPKITTSTSRKSRRLLLPQIP